MSNLSNSVGVPTKFKGDYDASVNVVPTDSKPGEIYKVTVAGTINGEELDVNDTFIIKADGTAEKISGDGGGDPAYIAESIPNVLPSATGTDALAMGESASAQGNNSISIGSNSDALQSGSISIGEDTVVNGLNGVALGKFTSAAGTSSIALGSGSSGGYQSIAAGQGANASWSYAIAIGTASKAILGNDGISIGRSSESHKDSIALGRSAFAKGEFNIALGGFSYAHDTGTVAIGRDSVAGTVDNGSSSTGAAAIGRLAKAYGYSGTAIGHNATAGDDTDVVNVPYTVAIGHNAIANKREALSIGRDSKSNFEASVALGTWAETITENEFNLSLGNLNVSTPGSMKDRTIMRQEHVTGNTTTVFAKGVPVPLDTLWVFEIIVAVTSESTATADESAAYKLTGAVKNSGGTTTLKGTVSKEILFEDVPAWDVNISANDTTDELDITWDFGGDAPVDGGAAIVGGLVTAKYRITETFEV